MVADEIEMDNFGHLKVRFNRDVVYDPALVEDYIDDYDSIYFDFLQNSQTREYENKQFI